MTPLLLLAGVVILVAMTILMRTRSGPGASGGPILPGVLLPADDPLPSLLLRANHALGVWVRHRRDDRAQQAVQARLDRATRGLVEERLERSRASAVDSTEVLEEGILVQASSGDWVAAALLPPEASAAGRETTRADLHAVMARLEREPVLAAIGREQDRPKESAESMAMRLAHQVERLLDTEVAVALARPQGVQVVGVSLRSDPRLRLAVAAPDSPLDRVGRGIIAGPEVSDDPLGRAGAERRRARPHALVLQIPGIDLPVGAVVVATTNGALPDGDQRGQLFGVLQQAGPRLARALDRQELEETTLSDPLTGVRNRRGLERAMGRVEHGIGALIYADLDRFKGLNDALGHAAGDAALVHFARLLGQGIRSGDVVARIGGEEFAVWLPGASLEEGAVAAERIRAALEGAAWAWQGTPWPLTASFGVAGCPESVPSVAHLPERADAALYRAKGAGRNQVARAG